MASEAAKQVAQEVILTVGNGSIPNKEKIQLKHGYSKVSARKGKAIQTKTYKKELQPYVIRLEAFREKILTELEGKDLTKVRFKELNDALNKNTHDIQLLSGGSTENIGVGVILDKLDET